MNFIGKELLAEAKAKGFYWGFGPNEIFPDKKFQMEVLFPHCEIPMPYTVCLDEFSQDYFPVFIKNFPIVQDFDTHETHFIDSKANFRKFLNENHNWMERWGTHKVQVQEYINPVTDLASHFRIVLALDYMRSFVLGAILLYNPKQEEKCSNGRRGGVPIALTGLGSLEDLTEEQTEVFEQLGIERGIPTEIMHLLNHSTSQHQSLFQYLSIFAKGSFMHKIGRYTLTGIDVVYGASGSKMLSESRRPEFHSQKPSYYFMEAQIDCGYTKFQRATKSDLKSVPAALENKKLHIYRQCNDFSPFGKEIFPIDSVKFAELLSDDNQEIELCGECLPILNSYFPLTTELQYNIRN